MCKYPRSMAIRGKEIRDKEIRKGKLIKDGNRAMNKEQ
jgi:hypothetical protein